MPTRPARAATDTWTFNGSGNWSTATNWSSLAVPGNGDTAILRAPGTSAITITFDPAAVATNLAVVSIDSTNTGLVTFSQSLGAFTVGSEFVGSNGAGVFLLSGSGTHTATNLTVGNAAGSSGTVTISGGAALKVSSQLTVGQGGSGVINQLAGSNTVSGSLTLVSGAGTGTYNLSAGTLTVNGAGEFIGASAGGVATFNQGGGSNTLGASAALELGTNVNTLGVYNMSNGAMLTLGAGGAEIVGFNGNGVLNQTGGTHTIASGFMTLGSGASGNGTVTLSGGLLSVGSTLTVGDAGSGVFTQSGGTAAALAFNVGASGTSSVSTYTLSAGTLTATNSIGVGLSGYGSVNQTGGSVTTRQLFLASAAAASAGTYTLDGTGVLSVSTSETIGQRGVGVFNQNAGSHTAAAVNLGGTTSGAGIYTLNAGALNVAGTVNVGQSGAGTFTQGGGLATINTLVLAAGTTATGTYNFNAGSLTVNAGSRSVVVGQNGLGTFTQNGGTAQITQLSLGGSFNANFPGFGGTSTQGTYTLNPGATLNVPNGEIVGDFGSGAFIQNGGTHIVGRGLNIGNNLGTNNASVQNSFTLNDGTLTSPVLGVGVSTPGTFTQNGGTNTVNGNAFIADGQSASFVLPVTSLYGSFQQQGGVTTITGTEDVGGLGGGSLFLYGGTHTTSQLLIGYVANARFGSGYVGVSGGTFRVTQDEVVGYLSSGQMVQNGGSHTVADLYVGYSAGATGTASLFDGFPASTLTVQGDEVIGFQGVGTFIQNGGLHTVGGLLTVQSPGGGSNASGAFTLSGGTLTAAVGNFGSMTIGGTAVFNGSLTNAGTLTLNGFTGTMGAAVINQGAVTVNGDFTFAGGFEHDGSPITIANHALLFNGPGMNNFSTLTLANGTLGGAGPVVNNGQISGFGKLSGTGGVINNGNLAVTGGALILADPLTNNGNLSMDAGQSLRLSSPLTNAGGITFGVGSFINGTASLSNAGGGVITGPGLIAAPLANAGSLVIPSGALNVTQPFVNAGLINLTSPAASLSGGAVTNTGTLQGVGSVSNAVVNQGTVEAIGGTLSVASLSNTPSGLLRVTANNKLLLTSAVGATNAGTISLVGGTFDTNGKPLVNAGTIAGYGTLATGGLTNNPGQTITLTGGQATVNGPVTNSAGGTMRVTYTPALFTHPVTNNGTIKVTGTTVTFAAPFTNNGVYASDPASNYFQTLTVGPGGALSGGPGDRFFVSGDFRSLSTRAATWDTADGAELHFTGDGAAAMHFVTLTGADRGPAGDGYVDNFAWGVVAVDAEQSLSLADGDATPGGALYVGTLELSGAPAGDALASFVAAHLVNADSGNAMNVYYDPLQSANAYLNGGKYALGNGGVLAPAAAAATPEPAGVAVCLIGAGAAVLGRRRRGARVG